MDYKIYLYAMFLFLSIYIFSGVHIEKLMKQFRKESIAAAK